MLASQDMNHFYLSTSPSHPSQLLHNRDCRQGGYQDFADFEVPSFFFPNDESMAIHGMSCEVS